MDSVSRKSLVSMDEDSEDSQEENLISSLLKHYIQGLSLAKKSDISLTDQF